MITVDFEKLRVTVGSRVLDVGCGSGRHTGAALRRGPVKAVAADVSFEEVLKARKRLDHEQALGAYQGGAWAVLVADMTCLPFKDDCFDLVICSEALEHVPEHVDAVQEVVRVLKTGRDLVVSVPRYLPERLCWALSEEYRNKEGGHVRIYKKGQLTGLLEKAGAKKWASHFAHSLHTPFWWLKCLVGPGRTDSAMVKLYHRFLVWDMMKKPLLMRVLSHLLNPFLGKSTVIYLRKE